jgi:3-phosphoshikimate 1-carboxyvinyltransferase
LAALHLKEIVFTGIESLAIKETDRIEALKNELQKINITWHSNSDTHFIKINQQDYTRAVHINTYHDHRMAMAFTMLAMKFDELYIDDKEVVNKSYPNFWIDLTKMGFRI